MTALRRSASLPFTAFVLAFTAHAHGQEVRYGPAHAIGEGTVRTYVVFDGEGRPAELGYAVDEAVLRTIPDGRDFVVSDDPMTEAPFLSVDLDLPEGHGTPFRFATFDWNPKGHPPPRIYDLPHFDFHVYLVDVADRDAIVPADVEELEARGGRAPEAGLLPENYVYPGHASVPRMGGHWIDPVSHEFHGHEFDRTFLFGTWDGTLIFYEPMITKAWLESRQEASAALSVPSRFPAPGWYPTGYRVYFDADANEHRVALTEFVERG